MFVAKLPVNQAKNSPSTKLLPKSFCRFLVNSTPEIRYVEPQHASSIKCSLEEHSVCSTYTLLCYMYHEIGNILYMYRACMIPTRYAHILKTIDTQSERCQVFYEVMFEVCENCCSFVRTHVRPSAYKTVHSRVYQCSK